MTVSGRARLGGSDVVIDRFGLGTAPLGGWPHAIDEARGVEVVQSAWDAGVRHFDTAPYYGFGNSERWLSRVLSSKPRGSFTSSTKVGRRLVEGEASDPLYQGAPKLTPVFDFSYGAVLDSLRESRQRLGIDYFDIVLVHDPDDYHQEALSGCFEALRELRRAGDVGAIGFAMNASEPLSRFVAETDSDCVLLAGRYTLLEQHALDDLLPIAVTERVSVIAGGVYNSGLLADPRASAMYDYAPASDELVSRALRIEEVCRDNGVPLRAAAMQFPLTHPAVASVVVGAVSPREAVENVELLQAEIPATLWQDLERAGLLRAEAARHALGVG